MMENEKISVIKSLINLLDDPNPRISKDAENYLLEMGESIQPILIDAFVESEIPEIREMLGEILRSINMQQLQFELMLLGNEYNVETLEHFTMKIARLEYPDMDVTYYKNEIERIATQIRDYVTVNSSKLELIQGMNWVLFHSFGLKSNRTNYYDPQNCYINRVLDRKKGIPVTLSILYILIARKLGFELSGVALPGHFLITPAKHPGRFFIDAYSQGRLLSENDCRNIVEQAGITYNQSFLTPVSTSTIIARVLRNLVFAFKKENNDQQLSLYENLVNVIET